MVSVLFQFQLFAVSFGQEKCCAGTACFGFGILPPLLMQYSCTGYRNPGDNTPCGSKPGPLIRMEPGTTYKLTLHNASTDLNLKTNIHTHGLHITGSGDGDDITRFVTGGNCLDYTWDIPSDHPGGTNWYHPHYHTLTNAQTAGGAFGMLIIEDDTSQLNAWAHPQNELLLLVSDTGTVLGNGNSNSDELFRVEVGRWYRLRVSTVKPNAAALSFNGGSCTVHKVASDGIWHNAPLTTYTDSSFDMTGASRADYAIRCDSTGSTTVKWGRSVAATIETGSFGSNTGSDDTDLGTSPSKPASLTGLTNGNADGTYSISMSGAKINGQTWDENVSLGVVPYGGIYEWTIIGSGAHPYHQHLYHMLIVEPGGCGFHEEGEFYDTLSASGSCLVRFYAIDIGQRMVLVRTCLTCIGITHHAPNKPFLMHFFSIHLQHCHVLGHEDNGAMTWMDVTGTPSANQNNVDSPAYQCGDEATPTTPPPSPAPTAPTSTPPPSPAPTETSNQCQSCGGLGSSDCRACTNCNWSKGSCEAIRRVLRGKSMED